jgi:predicted DNA-binding transcriptional regulator AlpA
MSDNVLFLDEVKEMTRLSEPTINKYIKERGFPVASKVGPRNAWWKSEVKNWIESQMNGAKKAGE